MAAQSETTQQPPEREVVSIPVRPFVWTVLLAALLFSFFGSGEASWIAAAVLGGGVAAALVWLPPRFLRRYTPLRWAVVLVAALWALTALAWLSEMEGTALTFAKATMYALIAVALAALIAVGQKIGTPRPAAMKVCPDCAESVLAAANVCKHCGHRFTPAAA
jgi:hypothetical protein